MINAYTKYALSKHKDTMKNYIGHSLPASENLACFFITIWHAKSHAFPVLAKIFTQGKYTSKLQKKKTIPVII